MSQLAIAGGQPVHTAPYPPWPIHDERDEAAVLEVVRSGRWGGYPEPGPKAAAFAEKFAAMQDARFGIGCTNGSVSLSTALQAAGVTWGDEVIVPAYTFVATAWAPLAVGAVTILADIDPDTLCLSPTAIEQAITERTKAIIPVHVGGLIADMDAIMEIARRHNLIVIEDAAHAHGARWRDRGVGSIGHFGSFSCQSSKVLTSGEGGIILTNDEAYAEACHSLIDCGRPKDSEGKTYHFGANFRLPELQAALLLVALERLEAQTVKREENATYLDERLNSIPGVHPQKVDERVTRRAVYGYVFRFDRPAFAGLDARIVGEALRAEGIECGAGWPPMYRDPLFQPNAGNSPVYRNFPERLNLAEMFLPVCEAVAKDAIWVSHRPFLGGQQEMDDIAEALLKVQEQAEALRDLALAKGHEPVP